MIELRYNTAQIINLGVVLTKITRLSDPFIPIYGALLSQCMYAHLIKANGVTVTLSPREWTNINNVAGCYSLQLIPSDVNVLGSLYFYAYRQGTWELPIFQDFSVISQNVWDNKYGSKLLNVETAQKG